LGIYREKFKFAEYQDRDVENGRFSGHCEVLPIRLGAAILGTMKAVQVTLDEELLRQLERDPEVKKLGRSAIVRRAIREYLHRRAAAAIDEAYRRGYATRPMTRKEQREIDEIIAGQAWPED
jgi:predicted transcriptional regulator